MTTSSQAICPSRQQFRLTFLLLSEMLGKGIAVETESLNTAISSCGRDYHWQIVVHVLRMLGVTGAMSNSITYNLAVTACDESRRWAKAFHFLRGMPQNFVQHNLTSCSLGSSVCETSPEHEEAVQLSHEMSIEANMPNEVSLNSDKLERASMLLEEIPNNGFLPDTAWSNSDATAGHKANYQQQAVRLFEKPSDSDTEGMMEKNSSTVTTRHLAGVRSLPLEIGFAPRLEGMISEKLPRKHEYTPFARGRYVHEEDSPVQISYTRDGQPSSRAVNIVQPLNGNVVSRSYSLIDILPIVVYVFGGLLTVAVLCLEIAD
eukprot:TRINITY_DN70072_c0_g1_i1.p1 TRINITY_DN70072_c0_g1~~TRINITY_DN70072_c0_g1_i1.p1  ORF type:complete len:318 (+),score=31.58 TRINITY_DN70072_c0_g1_i1:95-1048(+)